MSPETKAKIKEALNMFKAIIKLFMPSASTLSEMAAKQIQTAVNAKTNGKEEIVAKYAALAEEATAISKSLAGIMKDGKIDDNEAEALSDMIEPLCQKAIDLLK